MDMEMWYGFAAVGAVVDDQPEPAFRHAFSTSDLPGNQQQMSEQRLIRSRGQSHPRNRLARDDQNMYGSLRRNITESYAAMILKHDHRWDLLVADLFKKCFVSHVEWSLADDQSRGKPEPRPVSLANGNDRGWVHSEVADASEVAAQGAVTTKRIKRPWPSILTDAVRSLLMASGVERVTCAVLQE